jgi:lysophospholipid acyltransferase (LPLAT)-like uncharacterized protein
LFFTSISIKKIIINEYCNKFGISNIGISGSNNISNKIIDSFKKLQANTKIIILYDVNDIEEHIHALYVGYLAKKAELNEKFTIN